MSWDLKKSRVLLLSKDIQHMPTRTEGTATSALCQQCKPPHDSLALTFLCFRIQTPLFCVTRISESRRQTGFASPAKKTPARFDLAGQSRPVRSGTILYGTGRYGTVWNSTGRYGTALLRAERSRFRPTPPQPPPAGSAAPAAPARPAAGRR